MNSCIDTTASLIAYLCDDGNAEIKIEARSAKEAAQEYVDDGDWGDNSKTFWVTVYVTQVGEDDTENFDVEIDPEEPLCPEGEHNWVSPLAIVGGIKENPGVIGHGGGVIINEVCSHCGCSKITDTWAQNPHNGIQGLTSVAYEPGAHDPEEIQAVLQT